MLNFKLFKNKKIIIAGCSRFGASLAETLNEQGFDVTMIDIDASAFQRLSDSYSGFQVTGDACDIDVLEQCGIQNIVKFIAATDSDNVNCMIAQIASIIYHVEEVYVRLYDGGKAELLKDTSIKAIYPAKLCLKAFEDMSSMPVRRQS